MRIKIPAWLLLRVAERDNWTCHICKQGYIPGERWEVNHNHPLSKLGTNHVKNLRLSHRRCNRDLSNA